jgi:hypothetical protein
MVNDESGVTAEAFRSETAAAPIPRAYQQRGALAGSDYLTFHQPFPDLVTWPPCPACARLLEAVTGAGPAKLDPRDVGLPQPRGWAADPSRRYAADHDIQLLVQVTPHSLVARLVP